MSPEHLEQDPSNPLPEMKKRSRSRPRPALRARLRAKHSIIINDKIGDTTLEEAYFDLLELMENEEVESITIYIHSLGGVTYDYLPLMDLIRHSETKICTVGMGQVMSGALMIFVAGHERWAHDNTIFMSHDLNWGLPFDNANLNESRARHFRELEKIHERLMIELTDIRSKEEYRGIFPRGQDTFFYTKDAIEYGMVDRVIGDRD